MLFSEIKKENEDSFDIEEHLPCLATHPNTGHDCVYLLIKAADGIIHGINLTNFAQFHASHLGGYKLFAGEIKLFSVEKGKN